MKLSNEQISELQEVFKEEAMNHIKAIGKTLVQLTEGETDDAIEALGLAYREAHGLKGSASTIGVTRVARLGEKLEEVLRLISNDRLSLRFEDIEMLLDTLDTIRKSLDDLTTSMDELSDDEKISIRKLDDFIARHTEAPSEAAGIPKPPPPEEVTKAPKKELDLPSDQMSYLMSVFRTEAGEHIKSLAELLFNLEEGSGDASETLVKAFREAHSLKGSSGTIGFERVATVTHALEDVFGALQKSPESTTPKVIDVLLDTIDVIRRSIKEASIGDASLSTKEAATVEVLKDLVASLRAKESQAPVVSSIAPPIAPPISRADDIKVSESPPKDRPSIKEVQPRDNFIRVSEESIANLIAQVGELFEAHLYLTSTTSDLKQLDNAVGDLLKGVSQWRQRLDTDTKKDTEAEAIHDRIRGLRIQLAQITKTFSRDERQFSKLIQNSQEALRKIRLAPVSTIFVMIRRQVREICRLTNKRVELFLDGGEYAVDRTVLEAIEDPLIHLLRNAVDHGIEHPEQRIKAGKSEKGRISVVARHIGDAVELSISDDGQGIDPEKVRAALKKKKRMKEHEVESMSKDELFDYLFESGVSTQSDVSKISGRGVGLDVVKYTMERLGGEVRLNSQMGRGTEFNLRLPLSMSTLRCLLFKVSGRIMAIPASNIEKVILGTDSETKQIGGGDVITFKGVNIPMGSLSDLLHLSATDMSQKTENRIIVIISFGERRFSFQVDDIIEYAQIILRPLGDLLERVSYISGITLLGTGELALVLNPSDLVRAAGSTYSKRTMSLSDNLDETSTSARILVVDDSMATRTLEKTLLESAGYTVLTASDGYKALDVINTDKIDIVITDIQMPNMNGLELTRTLKTQYRFLQLPVVLVSSLGSDEDKARGLDIGADAYIVKRELSQKELVDTIEQLL